MTEQASSSGASLLDWGVSNPVQEYLVDAWQRSVLFLDVLRQRGNIAKDHNARAAPNVLTFTPELIVDGRTLARPVNYALVRIVPPPGAKIDAEKRPFIVVDPRAGHGPGIGGMKHDSEIGVAMAAGHPCYFVGFLPNPVPGQTIEDVCKAEAIFIGAVADRHPDAEGKPVLIGNCQAGWQLMMMAALNPDLAGPIMLAGSPLSYWAGVRGKNPLRYLGGVLGGTWLTALAGDLGHGIFDGADLVKNFELMNPANTLWQKPYNVYSKVDTEAERFLEFETWWGSPVLLNAEEMQWIADNLFVGNKLTAGELRSSDGTRIDLRNIRSPIIVFCSWGDDITPPQQALGWVTDLYDSDEEIVANGQTIVYTMHQSIGHLGIFVSSKVATKEHEEFATAMDMIDLAPPGLYEAVITDLSEDTANLQLISGRYLFRLELRSLDDIRALGNNDAEDDLRFATAARLSEVKSGALSQHAGADFPSDNHRTIRGDDAEAASRSGQVRHVLGRQPADAAGQGAGGDGAGAAPAGVSGQPVIGNGAGDVRHDYDVPAVLWGGARHDAGAHVPDDVRLAGVAGVAWSGAGDGSVGAPSRSRPAAGSERGASAVATGGAVRGRWPARGDDPSADLYCATGAADRRAWVCSRQSDPDCAAPGPAAEPAAAEGVVHRTVPAAEDGRGSGDWGSAGTVADGHGAAAGGFDRAEAGSGREWVAAGGKRQASGGGGGVVRRAV